MNRHYDDLQLGSIELFCAAAELESFSQAAATLGVTPAAVSRNVARLEERLGIRLFTRTTRQIRLTIEGRAYHRECRQALQQLIEAEREITGQQTEPTGTVRISVPTTFGHYRVLPLLPAFNARYPKIRVDVHVGNRNVQFAEEGYDLAVRVRALADSGLVARKLEDAALVVVASPDYLKKAGTPKHLEDLRCHQCIQFALPRTGRIVPWQFVVEGKEQEVETRGNMCCYEDVLAGVTLARNGGGLFQTLRFVVEEDLAHGSLVEVLQVYGGSARPISLIYPSGRHLPLRVRVFIDFLLSELTEIPKAIAKNMPAKKMPGSNYL